MLERWLIAIWAALSTFCNSNFGTALLSALIGTIGGAWGGAYAIQKIAEKAKRREHLIQEIGNSNSALEQAYVICTAYVNHKHDSVLPMKEAYENMRDRIHEHYVRAARGEVGPELDLGELEHRILDTVNVRIDRLEMLVMERLSIEGRPRGALAMLSQIMPALNSTIQTRNQMLQGLRAAEMDFTMKARIMFGLPLPGMQIDTSFGDTVEAIGRYSDNCIDYSYLLAKDLEQHGKDAYLHFQQRFRGPAPKPHTFNMRQAFAAGLMPAEDDVFQSMETTVRASGWADRAKESREVVVYREESDTKAVAEAVGSMGQA